VWSTVSVGGSAAGAVCRPSFGVHCGKRWNREEHGLEVTLQGQPDDEEETGSH